MPNKNELTKNNHGKILSQWDFPESHQYQRPRSWYIWLGIISAGLIFYAFYTFNFLFALFIFLADIIFISVNKKNNIIKFSIAEDGLEIGKNFYHFKELEKFWLIYEPPVTKKLNFEFKNKFKPKLSISLENQNPLKIRTILLKYLTEDLEQENESLGEEIEKWLKL